LVNLYIFLPQRPQGEGVIKFTIYVLLVPKMYYTKFEKNWNTGYHDEVCLFVCFESHEQFFSYLATVAITGDWAANLDLCLALTALSSEGSFTCHTYCDTGPPFFKVISERPVILPSECRALGEGGITTYSRRLPARAGLELTTYCLLSESTTGYGTGRRS
jgi:hypothetical protein